MHADKCYSCDVPYITEESKLDRFNREIDKRYSILSASARDDIKTYVRLAMTDGYDRGVEFGKSLGKKK